MSFYDTDGKLCDVCSVCGNVRVIEDTKTWTCAECQSIRDEHIRRQRSLREYYADMQREGYFIGMDVCHCDWCKEANVWKEGFDYC